MPEKVALLLIDPQFDFCNPNGALYVAGADQDSIRVSNFIRNNINDITQINVTLDTHHYLDIAHPSIYTRTDDNTIVAPFTIITEENGILKGHNVISGDNFNVTMTNNSTKLYEYVLAYVRQLAANQRYPLCIWPPHCLIGSLGHTIDSTIYIALSEWEMNSPMRMINYLTKGSNWKTEHYSAVKADVPDGSDPTTQLNMTFINTINNNDKIFIAGQALSHCVANTVRDIIDTFSDEDIAKFIILSDCSSNVPGFEAEGQKFIDDMTQRGMKIMDSTTIVKDLS